MPGGFETMRSLLRSAVRGRNSERRDEKESLSPFFGPLEIQVLDSLWRLPGKTSVRRLQERFPRVAYTTLMTTLDRLYKKGVLEREKRGRAFLYVARFTPPELRAALAAHAFDGLLGAESSPHALRPILSTFVETVSRRDALLLDDLEEMIRSRRREGGDGRSGGSGR